MQELFAIGKLGGPVRLVLAGLRSDAFTMCQKDEVVCLLHTRPEGPYMILPDGSDVVPIPPTIEECRASLWSSVKAIRKSKLAGSCWTPKGSMTVNTKDALVLYSQGFKNVYITMADDESVLHTPQEMQTALECIAHFIDAVHQHSVSIRSQIDAASTNEELNKIDPEANWPKTDADPR